MRKYHPYGIFFREVDNSIGEDDKMASDLKGKKSLEKFLDHCCVSRHYFFVIKKCGTQDCDICSPPRSPPEVFASLHQMVFLYHVKKMI